MDETPNQSPAPEHKPGKNNRIVIIAVVAVVLVLVIGGFAARMFSQKLGENMAENMIESATGGKADVDINSDSVTVKTDEGSFSTAASLPDGFPSDVPVYPGSAITYSGTNNQQTGDTEYVVVLSTTDSYQKVGDYYTAQLASQGCDITSTQSIAGTTVISASKDTRTLSMSTATADDGTTITLGVTPQNQ